MSILVMPQSRPRWEEIWMGLAEKISKRSTCRTPDRQVGCVIVTSDNERVLSNGYNGGAKGDDNKCSYSDDDIQVGTSRCTCAHAEMNALVKLDSSSLVSKVMYITLSPCALCATLIKNAGINMVVYKKLYNQEVVNTLIKNGVNCVRYDRLWQR